MLKKLLKYDLRAVFRVWWMAAVISIGLALLGGGCMYIINNDRLFPDSLITLCGATLFLVYFALFAFSLLTMVLIFIRLYNNFFTDEGYLTFTLPVDRLQLVNSKIITGVVSMLATQWMIGLDMALMSFLGDPWEFFDLELWEDMAHACRQLYHHAGNFLFVYGLEALVLSLLIVVLTVLFLYTCVSFASMIVKKGKLIAAIGIYYGAHSIVVTLIQILSIFGGANLFIWFSEASDKEIVWGILLILLVLICFIAMFCGLLYGLMYYLVDRKLNLS